MPNFREHPRGGAANSPIENGGEIHLPCVVLIDTSGSMARVKKQLEDGTLHVFDTSKFTVNGETLTSYQADVDTDANYTPDTEVIADGYFHESEYRSAPYFDLRIDGITLLNEAY